MLFNSCLFSDMKKKSFQLSLSTKTRRRQTSLCSCLFTFHFQLNPDVDGMSLNSCLFSVLKNMSFTFNFQPKLKGFFFLDNWQNLLSVFSTILYVAGWVNKQTPLRNRTTGGYKCKTLGIYLQVSLQPSLSRPLTLTYLIEMVQRILCCKRGYC